MVSQRFHWICRLLWVMQSFSQCWLFQSKNMAYVSICLCHLWFLSYVSYSFLHTGLLSLSLQFASVTQSCLPLCNPMDSSMPGLLIHHQLPEFTQIHVHWVSDAIQPSLPLSSPSPSAFNLSQHQGLCKWVSFSYQVSKVLEFQL